MNFKHRGSPYVVHFKRRDCPYVVHFICRDCLSLRLDTSFQGSCDPLLLAAKTCTKQNMPSAMRNLSLCTPSFRWPVANEIDIRRGKGCQPIGWEWGIR